MRAINCFPFVKMGMDLRGLLERLNTEGKYTYNDLARDAASVITSLGGWVFDTIFSSHISKPEADVIGAWLMKVSSSDYLKEHGLEEVPDRFQLINQINHFLTILEAELSAALSYYVTEKRNWDTRGLMFTAEKDIDEPYRKVLPWECVTDIRDAGRCIAFELPTAVGFHVCRAIETVLFLYFGVLDISLKGVGNPGMGTYIGLIEKRGVNEDLINKLKIIKDLRNALMHPDVVLESDQAQDLFQESLKVITIMVKDMVHRNPLLLMDPEEWEKEALAKKAEKEKEKEKES
jgi:hypothetical protein